MVKTIDIPVAHISDAASVSNLLAALQDLHGPGYRFALERWEGETLIAPRPGQVIYRFIIEAESATLILRTGDLVRGPASDGPYRLLDGAFAEVSTTHPEPLWSGDVLTVDEQAKEGVLLRGRATYFEVIAEQTGYRAPRLAMLRHLSDRPGGCAAYSGAFRREAIPPEPIGAEAIDPRGPNRVHEHTLDMRLDRTPTPIRHYHGPLVGQDGQTWNQSETAIVLPRSVYDLPAVESMDQGQIRLYRRPAEDPSDQLLVPVRPGSIVVTPATEAYAVGHCFENAFAMLVAIPGFMVPYNLIAD